MIAYFSSKNYHQKKRYQGNVLVFLENILYRHCPRESRQARFSAGEVERGQRPLSAGGQGTRRFLVYLCLLSLHKKVGAGVGCVTPQSRKFDKNLRVGKKRKHFTHCLKSSFCKPLLCGAARSTPRYLSFHEERYERRV